MSNVADRRIAELQNRVERLETFIDDVVPALLCQMADLEACRPRRKITAPPWWLSAQQAAHKCGMSLSDFYRKWRKLGIIGKRTDSCFMFDPASLPVRKL
jgi:hypothetical protein